MLPENSTTIVVQPEKNSMTTPRKGAYDEAFDVLVQLLFKEYRKQKQAKKINSVTN